MRERLLRSAFRPAGTPEMPTVETRNTWTYSKKW
jgi:hypothetical protein